MAHGIVKWFNNKKGFGFIVQEGGGDIFVHYSAINMPGFKALNEGDRVICEVEETDRGPAASDVKKSEFNSPDDSLEDKGNDVEDKGNDVME